MEYTATSFAEPLQRVFDDVLRPSSDVDVTHYAESRVPGRARSSTGGGCPTGSSTRLYDPVLAAAAGWAGPGAGLATGSVHRYLGYGFYARLRAAASCWR